MSFPCTTVPRPGSVELCAPQNCCTTAAAVILASSIAAQRSASTDLGFADTRYAVKWNDHSGQSLCSPVNVGALPMVLVSTRGAATFGTAATCFRVSIRALSVCTRPALPHPISSEHQSSLRLKCCLIISSSPRAPLPRLRNVPLCSRSWGLYSIDLYPWIPIARPIPSHAVPQQSTTTRHVNRRMLPGVTRMKCVSTETPREYSDRSACTTHCEQRLQLREQKNTYRDFTRNNKKR